MELSDLRYFTETARQESMTKASRALHVTQPVLSVRIKKLEEELGCDLFFRRSHSVVLTDSGRIFYDKALKILALTDDSVQEIIDRNSSQELRGELRFGCAQSYNVRFIAQTAEALRGKYPGIRYRIESNDAYSAPQNLSQGTIDFAAVTFPVDYEKYNHIDFPGYDTWGVLMREEEAAAVGKTITLEQLRRLPLMVPRQGRKFELPRFLGEQLDSLNIIGYFDFVFNASQFTLAGFGCALSYEFLVPTGPGTGLQFLPVVPEIHSPMQLIWQKHQLLTPVQEVFLEELRRQLKPITN